MQQDQQKQHVISTFNNWRREVSERINADAEVQNLGDEWNEITGKSNAFEDAIMAHTKSTYEKTGQFLDAKVAIENVVNQVNTLRDKWSERLTGKKVVPKKRAKRFTKPAVAPKELSNDSTSGIIATGDAITSLAQLEGLAEAAKRASVS